MLDVLPAISSHCTGTVCLHCSFCRAIFSDYVCDSASEKVFVSAMQLGFFFRQISTPLDSGYNTTLLVGLVHAAYICIFVFQHS